MKDKRCSDPTREIGRVHVYVSGVVQGVFFRAHTTQVARSLGLTGWVRNLIDGRVEAVAEGARDRIDEFLSWCEKGPPAASVESIEVSREQPVGDMSTFQTRY